MSGNQARRRRSVRYHVMGIRVVMAALAVVLGVAGCGATDSDSGARVRVVADVTPLGDLVRHVAGDRAQVSVLVPLGADGHTYEPRPGDLRTVAKADLFITNGRDLNKRLVELADENLPEEAPIVRLAEDTVPEKDLVYEQMHSHGKGPKHGHGVNAHMWTNVPYAIAYVQRIEKALAQVDPDGKATYATNAAALRTQLDALDAATRTTIESIPKPNRKLVVYHDSWSYFGRTYGIPVIGAIQPANFSEPSAAEVKAMVKQIRSEKVPAFFGSEVFPSDVLEAIAAESGADYNADLSDERLPGKPGDAEHSYVGMMVQNARIMAKALGGDAAPLDTVPLTPGAS